MFLNLISFVYEADVKLIMDIQAEIIYYKIMITYNNN